MNQYFKNFILCGDIDHHCLLCHETFTSIADVEKHIRWERHRKSWKLHNCMGKFRKDSIYKIQDNYYCQFCNYVMQNLNEVNDHVSTEKHKANKVTPAVPKEISGRYDVGFVIIKNFIISSKQWHGIDGNHCVLCETTIDNTENHMKSHVHVVKLIQTEINCIEDQYYRMVNEEFFQCFTCNKLFPMKNLEQHWSDEEHCNNLCGLVTKEFGSTSKDSISYDKKVEFEEKLIESQKMFFHIDMKNKIATCKICRLTIDASFKDMIVHIKEHSDYKLSYEDILELKKSAKGSEDSSEEEVVYWDVADHGKRRAELSIFGKQHSIRLNASGSKGFCMICNKYLSAHKKVFKQHIKGTGHKALTEIKNGKSKMPDKIRYTTQTVIEYVQNLLFITELREFWVNGEYCIGQHSLMLLYPVEGEAQYQKTICFVCDTVIPREKEGYHCKTNEHKNNVMDAKVMVMKDEFIREVHPNIYHCGFCNQIYPYWDGLNRHFQSWKHRSEKMPKKITSRVAKYYNDQSPVGVEITPNNNHDLLYLQLMVAIFS